MAKNDEKNTQGDESQTESQKEAQARIEQATVPADEREYEPVPDDEKPDPSTLMHREVIPGA